MNLTLSSSVIFLDDGHGLVKAHRTIPMSNWILHQQYASLKPGVCEDASDDDGKLCFSLISLWALNKLQL